jgi:ubiquinone/menaquinone biosynthesis C-methylase UbiE|uniref:Class I SAM-dependent methyltransferase n=1 Tax=Desulfobacca acetoxidans TaxID=60893 RepID=A0A7V6A2T3_9BACT
MKANRLEQIIVNSPVRLLIQEKIILRWLKSKVKLPPGGTFLEIGCGRGAGACLLLREFLPDAVHAMDLDEGMINRAKGYVRAVQREHVHLYVGDALYLPYRAGAVDAVFGFGVLHHLPDWRAGIREIARVLKSGGVYFLEEFYPPFYLNPLVRRLVTHPEEDRFYSADLRQALAEAGLPIEDAREVKALGLLAVCRKQ